MPTGLKTPFDLPIWMTSDVVPFIMSLPCEIDRMNGIVENKNIKTNVVRGLPYHQLGVILPLTNL